jgi:hypothetical protein
MYVESKGGSTAYFGPYSLHVGCTVDPDSICSVAEEVD